MTSSSPENGGGDALPRAEVAKGKGIPIIWIIPLVAVLIGGWLWYRAIQEQGPEITITFETADGLEAGKTKIKFKDLEVGKVTNIDLSPDLEHVIVKAEMVAGSEPYMVDQTRFWVVKPRIGAGGISGLGTIVSGAYIAMDLTDEGAPTSSFTGLEEPPIRAGNEEGLSVLLQGEALGSLETGTPIYYRQVEVGQVERYHMLPDRKGIEFKVFIEGAHAGLVTENTRFWSTSGIRVSLNAQGFDVQAESLQSLLMGGIAFGVPPEMEPGAAVTDETVFELYPSREDAYKITNEGRRTMLYFDEPVNGLTVGAAVDFRGIELGTVLEVGIEFDQRTLAFRAPVLVETYQGRLDRMGPRVEETHAAGIKRLAAAGLRGRLSTPNLLTGARYIEVLFDKDSPETYRGPPDSDYPELPTMPSAGAAINEMIEELPEIVTSARETIDGINELVNSQETTETLDSVAASTASLQQILSDLEQRADPLLGSVDQTLADVRVLLADVDTVVDEVADATPGLLDTVEATAEAAQGAMASAEQGLDGLPALERRLNSALEELTAALRAVRNLADTLERQPEALVKGKGDD